MFRPPKTEGDHLTMKFGQLYGVRHQSLICSFRNYFRIFYFKLFSVIVISFGAAIFPYNKLDAYVRALQASDQYEFVREYDRLSNMLWNLRDLDFGVVMSWDPDGAPHFKGCEPMQKSKIPVHCETEKDLV